MSLPTGIPPPTDYLPNQHHLVPAEHITLDPSNIPQPTDGEHVVQKYGPKLVTSDNVLAQSFFEYSRCCGNRKAVLVGINYIGTNNALRGCINDARNMQKFLIDHFGYTAEHIILLTDDNQDPNAKPTKANIIKAMKWLVEGATRDDALFFHYSGHGTQTRDRKLPVSRAPKEKRLDERDNQDEAICPLDFETKGLMIDDEIFDALVKPLPAGCRLTAIFDSCNSGSVMDIPYVYQPDGTVKEPEVIRQADKGILSDALSIIGQLLGADLNKALEDDHEKAQAIMTEAHTSPADVICWSGCRDDQTSADTFEDGQNVGAMSWAFITSLTKQPKVSYIDLLVSIRKLMKDGRYTQVPQLSACHPIDTKLEFVA